MSLYSLSTINNIYMQIHEVLSMRIHVYRERGDEIEHLCVLIFCNT